MWRICGCDAKFAGQYRLRRVGVNPEFSKTTGSGCPGREARSTGVPGNLQYDRADALA